MDNYQPFSYPESGDSSPRSREIDYETPPPTWEEPSPPQPPTHKVKFMVSYRGKIQPRSHDSLLAYVGGETKILALDRTVKFSQVRSKLASLVSLNLNDAFTVKYQLPGEDLDALISVTNDDDLEHMMHEFDRLCKASSKPARLRLFLFIDQLLSQRSTSGGSGFSSISSDRVGLDRSEPVLGTFISSKQSDVVSDPALAAAAAVPIPVSVPQLLPVHNNVDYLFGLDTVSTGPVPVHVPGPVQVEPVQGMNRNQISAQELQMQNLQQQQQQQQSTMFSSTKNDENYGEAYRNTPSPVNVPANYQVPQGYWQPIEHQIQNQIQNQNRNRDQNQQPQQQQHQFHQQHAPPQHAVYMMHAPPAQESMYHAPPAMQPPNQGYYQMPVYTAAAAMMTAESAGYAPVNQVYYAAAAAQGGGVTAAYGGVTAVATAAVVSEEVKKVGNSSSGV